MGGFGGNLIVEDGFGSGIAPLGDLDGDGVSELAVGARESGTNDHGAVWILFLDGCFALDFELEDDFETQLQNGQHLNTEFGRRLTLASSGSNAGLALFDSTPGGPNDPSQDRDLLVDSGNVLIFQTENAPPDANDVFPLPNDDEDGGTLSMAFMLPVRLERLDLIDIDASEDTSTLVLTDAAGLTRTFSVPADWTGDLLLGQPGRGTLDLTTLEPQLGFGSVATAVEEPGFDPAAVVSLELQLGGSGALDDLRVCPVRTLAAATARNGSGQNPMNLRTSDRPVLGRTWRASLDCARGFSGLAVIEVRRRALAGSRFPFGELLIGGGLLQRVVQPYTFAGSPTDLILSVPPDLSLCGFEACVQGLCSDTLPASPGSKSLGARARLSNALDLVFGFQ